MNRRILMTALLGFMAIIIFNWSCTKLDTTNLGNDLLPVVDNVNTFADTMDIDVFQEDFLPGDTTTTTRLEDQAVGKIDNDPLFGSTNAKLFVQFKPGFYPFFFGESRDTIRGAGVGFDSVVLCLSYQGAWGDTAVDQRFQVKEIPVGTGGEWDSLFKPHRLSYAPNTGSLLTASPKTVNFNQLGQLVKFAHGKDSTTNQVRIKLDSTWGANFFYQDSALFSIIGDNAFASDSVFRLRYEGLMIESLSGKAIMYTSLTDANTRLEFHYRKRRNNIVDTTYYSLRVGVTDGTVKPSATANNITRARTIPNTGGGKDSEIYLQTTPGTYARLRIPRLDTYRDTNRIIHRAQIKILQIPNSSDPQSDKQFTAPSFMYLDLRDSTTAVQHKPIYNDLNSNLYYNPDRAPLSIAEPYFPTTVDFAYFGGYVKNTTDHLTGLPQSYYDFNITRYLQKMLISKAPNKMPNYEMRLFAPYSFSYPQLSQFIIRYPNSLAEGRVRVGGSSGSYKMQLVVIWSKVKVQ